MNRLEEHLHNGITEIANRAQLSTDAWDEITMRLTQTDSRPVESDTFVIESGPSASIAGKRGLALAAAAVVAVVSWLGFGFRTQADSEAPTFEPNVVNTTTANAEPSSAADVVMAYVSAINRGDAEQATALFADGVITRARSSIRNSGANPPVDVWQSYLDWMVAQGAIITDATCASSTNDGPSQTVRCQWRLQDAVALESDNGGNLVVLEATVESNLITVFDYTETLEPEHGQFTMWMLDNLGQTIWPIYDWGDLSSSEHAAELGEDYARLAAEWADSR